MANGDDDLNNVNGAVGDETPPPDETEPTLQEPEGEPESQGRLAYVYSQDRPSHGDKFEPLSNDDRRWMAAFAGEHDGRAPNYEDYYDRLWSISFARQTGRSPQMNDWRTHYYVKYSNNEPDTAVQRARYETQQWGWEPAQPLRVYSDDFGPWSIADRPGQTPKVPAETPTRLPAADGRAATPRATTPTPQIPRFTTPLDRDEMGTAVLPYRPSVPTPQLPGVPGTGMPVGYGYDPMANILQRQEARLQAMGAFEGPGRDETRFITRGPFSNYMGAPDLDLAALPPPILGGGGGADFAPPSRTILGGGGGADLGASRPMPPVPLEAILGGGGGADFGFVPPPIVQTRGGRGEPYLVPRVDMNAAAEALFGPLISPNTPVRDLLFTDYMRRRLSGW